MIISLVLLAIGQVKAEPLDAFRANRAAIRADIEFTYTIGPVDRALLKGGLWGPNRPEPREMRAQTALCRWEFDGMTEHLISRPPDDVASPLSSLKPGEISSYQFPFEMIFDGRVAAYHAMAGVGDATIYVAVTDRPAYIRRGPFNWMWPEPFPLGLIGDGCRGIEPTYTTMIRGGHPTEVAIYRKEGPGGWRQIEVCYDPSIGYLPRYIRMVAHGLMDDPAAAGCKEMYLLNARPCAAGGFVPTEYYDLSFITRSFPNRYDAPAIETISQFADRGASLAHFVVTKFEERVGPVRLDRLEGMKSISGVGGIIPLRAAPRTMTLAEARSRLGRKLTEPLKLNLPSLDSSELHQYDRRPSGGGWTQIILGILAVLAFVAGMALRRRKALAAIALIALFPGCGRTEPSSPIARLSGAFNEARVVYDPRNPWVRAGLTLTNDGNVRLAIRELSGGCSCRRAEQSVFPAMLAPGGTMKVPIEIHDRRQFDLQHIVFTATTEHGTINVPRHSRPCRRITSTRTRSPSPISTKRRRGCSRWSIARSPNPRPRRQRSGSTSPRASRWYGANRAQASSTRCASTCTKTDLSIHGQRSRHGPPAGGDRAPRRTW